MKATLMSILVTLAAVCAAHAQTYTLTTPAQVAPSTLFSTSWSISAPTIRWNDHVWLFNSAGTLVGNYATGGAASGTVWWYSQNAPGTMTVKYMRTGYKGASVNPTPAAVSFVTVNWK